MIRMSSPWLYRKNFDLSFILLPAFLSVFLAFLFGDYFLQLESQPIWVWVILVMGIDVSHVYSTLYKTYLHPEEYLKHKSLLFFIPLVVLVTGILLHTMSAKLFWTLLAYLAVFHFIRQQYGFMRLYGQKEVRTKGQKLIESSTIYAATLYPIIYWHTYPRDFHWFVEGDFLIGLNPLIERISFVIYLGILALYLFKEISVYRKGFAFNLPKNVVVIGTIITWYVGIVLFNGDFTFTVTNIVAHGIPYMALIWIWGRKNHIKAFSYRWAIIPFLVIILLLAYLEEGFWAGFVWREHLDVFGLFKSLPVIENKKLLSIVVPLLTLPQTTHYILDGYIWKNSPPERV